MSNSYKKIEFKCDCGRNYGDCGETGMFLIKYVGVSDTNALFLKPHPNEAMICYGHFTDVQISALGKLLSSQYNDLSDCTDEERKEINEKQFS